MCNISILYFVNTIILEIMEDEDDYDTISSEEDNGQTVED